MWIAIGGLAVPIVILTVLFVLGLNLLAAFPIHGMHGGMTASAEEMMKPEIRITGHQWWWQIDYLNDNKSQQFTTANELHLPAGRAVYIEVVTQDVMHSLWIPAFPLRIPLVLKPGSAEPWTPYRIIQSLIKAGAPREAFSFYPTDHAGAAEILRSCGRSLLFGDSSTTGTWANDPRVEIHGPGYSKIIIGADCVDDWEQYLDVMIASIADNGGRSCVNASAVWTPAHAAEISEALAKRLAQIVPRAADDENAQLAPFVDAQVAARINAIIEHGLTEPRARDVTAAYRDTERLVNWNGCSYLLPTVILSETDHPLAMKEFLFPFASVVQVDQDQIISQLGPTLVVTAITKDPRLIQTLVNSPRIDRLNIGALPTNQVSWDQPHEGNLFDHLYARRAFQQAVAV